jgi:uncharacterized membrane protein YqiK
MALSNWLDVLIFAGIVIVALFALGMIFSRMYRRASKEVSFVRTGFGGQSVIMNGGALVFPVLHEIIPVNMNTLRLEVRRSAEQALITRDRLRVDVTAEFYVRVKPTAESIANAAQTLGMKTMNPEALKDLVEGKFVDALRAVAAEMAMEELHEKRVDFVQKVQQAVSEDLLKNGLELETVSLTGLDQTSRDFFNPNNAFDAQGLTKLTEEIEMRRKERNDIEKETEVAIQMKNLETERQQLEISRDDEYARLMQESEVEIRRAQQKTDIAREQANKEQEAEEAKIVAKRQVDMANIEAERAVEEQRIEKDRMIKEQDIRRERSVETAEIDRRRTVELAEQDRAIAIAEKSKEESVAKADADRARADAVQAAEEVITVREKATAERLKAVELVEARQIAEKQAISITVAAEAEKQAADDQAESERILAQGRADHERISAEGESEAVRLRADAAQRQYEVDATGRRALNEADNQLSNEQIAMKIRIALLEALPEIIAQSVKPMESIDEIKLLQVDGLHGHGSAGGVGKAGDASSGDNLTDQLVSSALRYRSQAPLVDSLLNELGLDGSDLNGLTAALNDRAKSE